MKTHPWSEIRDRLQADPERWERIEAGKAALRAVHELAALRERQGMTQVDVATALDVSQARVSKIEHQEDVYLSTLREYVAAIGGELRVSVIFADETVDLINPDT
jgi:transcriptional regulator with XRE-family HTH domain